MEALSRSIKGVDEVFRRLSFGSNNGSSSNGSIVVAIGLILNYLDQTVDDRVIPGALKAELLVGSRWDQERYIQTNRLHGYLIRYCHFESEVYRFWGKKVIKRFRQYWQKRPWALGVIVRGSFGGNGNERAWELIVNEVDNNRPAMVTFKSVKINGRKHKNYTVAICGYRVTALGRRELFIHPGTYGEKEIKGSRVGLVGVPVKNIRCSYRFEVMLTPMAV